MKRILVIGATLGAMAFTTSAFADLATCAKIDNDLDRLSCYDKESGRTPTVEAIDKAETGNTGYWKVRTATSAFEDTTDVYLTVEAITPVTCGILQQDEFVRLVARCKENTTAFYIDTESCHLASGHGGYGKVDFRVDDRKAFDQRMDESTNNRALGEWRGRGAIPLLKKLSGGKNLVVRFTPFGQSPQTATFDISGLDNALKPLRKECGW